MWQLKLWQNLRNQIMIKLKLLQLEDTAGYTGLRLAPTEGFGIRPRLFMPFGQKKSFCQFFYYLILIFFAEKNVILLVFQY